MAAPRSFLLRSPVLVVPVSLAAPLLALLKDGRERWRDVPIGADVTAWLADLEQLAGEPPAFAERGEPVRWITVADAVTLLGLSPRQITAMAPKLGGRKVGRRWLLDEAEVLEEAEVRLSAAVSRRPEPGAS
jgi:hypothetical protein